MCGVESVDQICVLREAVSTFFQKGKSTANFEIKFTIVIIPANAYSADYKTDHDSLRIASNLPKRAEVRRHDTHH